MNTINEIKHHKYHWLLCLLIIIGNVMIIFADEEEEIETDPPNTQVSVIFTEGDAGIGPLDPEKPEIPELETGPGDSGLGPLVLNYVSTLSFGEQQISAFKAKYPAEMNKPCIQVTDLRGTNKGWSVTARASSFMNKGIVSLKGSSILIEDAFLATPSLENDPPIPSCPVILKTNGDLEKIVNAPINTGMGAWLVKWYTDPDVEWNESILLEVPGGSAMTGTNTATITWLLSDVPA